MTKPEISMSEFIQLLYEGGDYHGRTSCSPAEFRAALEAIVDPEFKKSGSVANAASRHPIASIEMLEDLPIPLDRRRDVARAICSTPNADIYEMVLSLVDHEESIGRPKRPSLSTWFHSSPDKEGARRIVDRLLLGYQQGRIVGIAELLAQWVSVGVLTDEQDAAVVDALMNLAEQKPGWSRVVGFLPAELATPWLLTAAEANCPQTAASSVYELQKFGVEIPSKVLSDISKDSVRSGALLDFVTNAASLLISVNPTFRLAATQAKAALSWKFICETGMGAGWTSGDPEPELEQIGMVDGESAETAGVIFVFKCRLPGSNYHEWLAGISGPYSVGEEPARHLGGLDYTDVAVGSATDTLEEQVESMIGVRLHFSTLAAKPSD